MSDQQKWTIPKNIENHEEISRFADALAEIVASMATYEGDLDDAYFVTEFGLSGELLIAVSTAAKDTLIQGNALIVDEDGALQNIDENAVSCLALGILIGLKYSEPV